MIRVLLLLLALSAAQAQDFVVKPGAAVTVDYDQLSSGVPVTLRVVTDPPLRGELLINLHRRGGGADRVLIRPPTEPGVHVFEAVFDETGEWGLWMRYGSGIDLYSEYLRFTVNGNGTPTTLRGTFRGALAADVPGVVEPLGYTVFGLLSALSLGLIVWTLRRFARQKRQLA